MEEFEVRLKKVWFGSTPEKPETFKWKWGEERMDKLMDSPWFLRLTALVLAVILFVSIQGEEGKINGKSPGDQIDMIRLIFRLKFIMTMKT